MAIPKIDAHDTATPTLEAMVSELDQAYSDLSTSDQSAFKAEYDRIKAVDINASLITIGQRVDFMDPIQELIDKINIEKAKASPSTGPSTSSPSTSSTINSVLTELKKISGNTYIDHAIDTLQDIDTSKLLPEQIKKLNGQISSYLDQISKVGISTVASAELDEKALEVLRYIGEINGIYNEFLIEKNRIEQETRSKKEKSIKDDIGEINIDGEFEIPDDIDDLLEQFDDAIFDINLKRNMEKDQLKIDQYTQAIELLEHHKKTLKALKNDTDEINGSDIEEQFDNAIDSVMDIEGAGPITVEILGVSRNFKSKLEALAILKEMKIQISQEMKSGWRSTWELISPIYSNVLNLTKNLTIGEFGSLGLGTKGLKDISKIVDGDVHYAVLGLIEMGLALGMGAVGISILTTFIGMHASVGESVLRRGIIDPVSRLSESMQYEDYGKRGVNTNPVGDPSKPGYRDFFEYQQREGLMQMFKQKLDSLDNTSKEYRILKENIKILESFKLNKTNTFYYISNKIAKDMKLGILGNLDVGTLWFNMKRTFFDGGYIVGWNPFMNGEDGKRVRIFKNVDGKSKIRPKLGGFVYKQIDRSQNLYSETKDLLQDMDKELTEGVQLFYKNKIVETKDVDQVPKNIVVKADGISEANENVKTERYQNIIDYINSRQISDSEKEELIKKFDNYIDKLGQKPKYKKGIYKDIYLLLNFEYENSEKLLSSLSDEIRKAKRDRGLIDASRERLLPDIVNDRFPKTKYDLLLEFRDLIYSGEWLGTEKEYKQALSDIELGNSISANSSVKLGSINPEKGFNDIIDSGKKFAASGKRVRETLFSTVGDSMENSTEKDYLKNIQDYIGYKIGNNKVEKSAREELDRFLKKVLTGKILFSTDNELKTEIAKILNGGMTQDTLINKLQNCYREDFSEAQKTKIKDLQTEIVGNPETIITEKQIDDIIKKIESNDLRYISLDHTNKIDLITIDANIESAKGLRKKDIFPEGANEASLKDSFDKLKAIIEFDSDSNDSLRTQELAIFRDNVINRKNRYTISQVLYILNEISGGSKLDNIDTNLASNTTNTLDDFITGKLAEIKIHFEGLYIDEKIQYLEKHKEHYGNNFKKSLLEDNIEKTISDIETSGLTNAEKVNKAENLRRSVKIDLDSGRIKNSIDKLISLKGISRLESSFEGYKREFKAGKISEKRKETILSELDKLYSNELADDKLKTQIDILKTEINESQTIEGPKPTTDKSKKQNKAKEKINGTKEKVDQFIDLHDRAILTAELNGNLELANKLLNEKNDTLINPALIQVDGYEEALKSRLGISKLLALSKIKSKIASEAEKIAQELVRTGVLQLVEGGGYKYEGKMNELNNRLDEIGKPKILKYLVKSLKTGG